MQQVILWNSKSAEVGLYSRDLMTSQERDNSKTATSEFGLAVALHDGRDVAGKAVGQEGELGMVAGLAQVPR